MMMEEERAIEMEPHVLATDMAGLAYGGVWL